MQLAIYRAERPEVFEDIIGQKHIVRILQNQIRTGTVSQAYLFSGTHGTGKTTTARILAKAVNCLAGTPGEESRIPLPCGECENCKAIRDGRFVDVIELDAASNNGVDDLRAIIDMVKYPPAAGRYKVYIIDEVHMLSPAAENAFLKTLEEPPEHAIFILATTDPQKVRTTIRSRCMQLNFKRIGEDELVSGLDRICRRRGISAAEDALYTIAARADGSVRDALSILEQCAAGGDEKLDRGLVLEYTGAAGEDFFLALTDAVRSGDIGKAFIYIDEIARRGKDIKQIIRDWMAHYRSLMIVRYVQRPERIISSSAENIERLRNQAQSMTASEIERAIRLLSEYINLGRYSERPRILLETAAVRLAGGEEPAVKSELRTARRSAPVNSAAAAMKAGKQERTDDSDKSSGVSKQEDGAAVSMRAEGGSPEIISPAPREQAGDPELMWNRIADEISKEDRSFITLVARQSRGTAYEAGELTVVVSANRMRFAEDKRGDITRAARKLFGGEVFVTIKEGDPGEGSGGPAPMSELETEKIIEDDVNLGELMTDVEKLFGMSPEIR